MRKSPQNSGFNQMMLLASLPSARRGAAAIPRLDELQRKFPDVTLEDQPPPRPLGFERVPSPIPPEAMPRMGTRAWISAMRTYDSDRLDSRARGLRGGMHELGSALKHQVQQDRARYANMMLELPDDLNPAYFDRILEGLVRDEGDDGQKNQNFPPVAMDRARALPPQGACPARPPLRTLDLPRDRRFGKIRAAR
jgi:hypothetical protein